MSAPTRVVTGGSLPVTMRWNPR